MKKSNKPLNRAERRRRKRQTLPKFNIPKDTEQANVLSVPSDLFDKEFVISVLNRNLAIQSHEDICKAAIICWNSLTENAKYNVQRAYGHIQGEVTELEFAPWAQDLSEWQKEPDSFFVNESDNAIHYILESFLAHKKARECSKLSLWGWDKNVIGFYYVLRSDALKDLLELFVKLGKYHSEVYEYRLSKLLYLSQLIEDGFDVPFLDVRGYDGDMLTAPQNNWSFVYVMRSNTGHYKIGLSQNPENRALELTKTPTILPIEIKVIHSFRCENAKLAELTLHKLFHYCRYKGEWFNLTNNQIKFLEDIKHFDNTVGFVPITAFYPC